MIRRQYTLLGVKKQKHTRKTLRALTQPGPKVTLALLEKDSLRMAYHAEQIAKYGTVLFA